MSGGDNREGRGRIRCQHLWRITLLRSGGARKLVKKTSKVSKSERDLGVVNNDSLAARAGEVLAAVVKDGLIGLAVDELHVFHRRGLMHCHASHHARQDN